MRLFRGIVIMTVACAFSLPVAAQEASGDAPGTISFRRGRYNVSGTVREAMSNRSLESVRVDLYVFGGGVVATTFSNSNGNFTFSNVRPGTYFLEVKATGYEPAREELNFGTRPGVGIQITLRPTGALGPAPPGDTVSARELAIPRRAREAMEKGMRLLQEESDYLGSVSQFQRAIREYPQYYEAYAQMGVAYMSLGDAARSEQMLRTSIDISEHGYADALFLLAAVYSAQKRFAEAEMVAREAVGLAPSSWQAHHELAHALHGLDQGAAAEASALEAIRLDPSKLQSLLLLANIHLRMRNYAALIKDLDHYLQLAPDGPDAPQARQMREQVLEHMANIQPRTAPASAP